jgi:hypothetical protein
MLTPSYDFNLFGLDQFSPLMANEFGAGTSFSAADPASYVDYSLNQLQGLLQPFNPLPYIQQQFPSLITPQSPFSFFQMPSRGALINPPQIFDPTTGKMIPAPAPGGPTTTVNVYTPQQAPAAAGGGGQAQTVCVDSHGNPVAAGTPGAECGYTAKYVCTDANGNQVPVGTPGAQCGVMYDKAAGLGAGFHLPGLPSLDKFLTDIQKSLRSYLLLALVIIVAIALLSRR